MEMEDEWRREREELREMVRRDKGRGKEKREG